MRTDPIFCNGLRQLANISILIGVSLLIFSCGDKSRARNEDSYSNEPTELPAASTKYDDSKPAMVLLDECATNAKVKFQQNLQLPDYEPRANNESTPIESDINIERLVDENGVEYHKINVEARANLQDAYYKNSPVHYYELGQYTITQGTSGLEGQLARIYESFMSEIKTKFDFEPSQIETCILGTADGSPFSAGTLFNDSSLNNGMDLTLDFFSLDDSCSKTTTLVMNKTRMTNEVLALLRGYVVKSFIENVCSPTTPVQLFTKTYKERGKQYRISRVSLIVRNLRKKQVAL
jgi:hypothetical protein